MEISKEKRKEITDKVMDSVIYQTINLEANIIIKERNAEAFKSVSTKEEQAKEKLICNAMKKQLQEFKDILIVLKEKDAK